MADGGVIRGTRIVRKSSSIGLIAEVAGKVGDRAQNESWELRDSAGERRDRSILAVIRQHCTGTYEYIN